MSERETWTTEEFGSSHTGSVGVLLADGSVPPEIFIPMMSSGGGHKVSQWSIYDGGLGHGPRAAALRAVCSCGWTGPEQQLDWDEIGDGQLAETARATADTCTLDWDAHTEDVERSAIPLPETVGALLEQLRAELEKLERTSPLAALRAARRLEVTAVEVGYWAAHNGRRDATVEQVAAALGTNEAETRKTLARFGRWSPYR
ncbi:hypothetical protein GCM10023084_82820 [Streptomyces lacrimifluminis]|uniref:Uncharacterized protein n=1 Tax=Streptomyces lacrimifluminis TaxID=1500077 RepID=A0A917PDZ7_9ACTN|nr:hypothetical protein [Streptomyces lacrimifluminis]GGJ72396.1 hypothetical protein GCM10012282_81550 [Streptomyces lacrimifluminis]